MVQSSLPPDRRLLGNWKSDRHLTLKHFRLKAGCSPKTERKFRSIFGHLIVRWTPKRYITELDGIPRTQAYEVVALDDSSVVVRLGPTLLAPNLMEKSKLLYIHFDKNHYWISAGGHLHEWFKRVETKPSKLPKTSTKTGTKRPSS